MSNIVGLYGSPVPGMAGEPQEAVIDMLRELLARAEDGSIQHVAVAAIDHVGAPFDMHVLGNYQSVRDAVLLVGALQMAQSVLVNRINEMGLETDG